MMSECFIVYWVFVLEGWLWFYRFSIHKLVFDISVFFKSQGFWPSRPGAFAYKRYLKTVVCDNSRNTCTPVHGAPGISGSAQFFHKKFLFLSSVCFLLPRILATPARRICLQKIPQKYRLCKFSKNVYSYTRCVAVGLLVASPQTVKTQPRVA